MRHNCLMSALLIQLSAPRRLFVFERDCFIGFVHSDEILTDEFVKSSSRNVNRV